MGLELNSNDFVDSIHRQFLRIADPLFRFYCYVVRPHRRGVYVVVWWKDRLLLVENSYRRELTLPSGGIKYREDPLHAAGRELEEEVGIRPDSEPLIAIGHFQVAHDHILDEIYAYELRLTESPNVAVDNREVVKYRFTSLSEALKTPLSAVARHVLDSYG